MKKDYFIITGTSRGIGEALALQLLKPSNVLFCISRNKNPQISTRAMISGLSAKDIEFDLSNVGKIRDMMRSVFKNIYPEEVNSLTLINNAGTIHPIRQLGTSAVDERMISSVNVNLTAPMLITEAFLFLSEGWDIDRKILNLSSGAAKRPVDGWGAYCSGKAGLDMFSRCLAKEQKSKVSPAKVVAFAPGVVDTEMQAEIRAVKEEEFNEVGKFRNYYESGELLSPDFVAQKILEVLSAPDFGNETIMSIRDML